MKEAEVATGRQEGPEEDQRVYASGGREDVVLMRCCGDP